MKCKLASSRGLIVATGLVASCILTARAWPQDRGDHGTFRPPAVPLVTSDPYLSVWSMADHLTDDTTRHWTRREHPLVSLIRVDGKTYRLMGKSPGNVPAMPQVGLTVLPTRSIYNFQDDRVHVRLTFMTPALPEDLDVLSRPLTYLTWDVRSIDGALHDIAIYDSTSALLAVNSPDQAVEWGRETVGKLTVLRAGTVDQTLLRPSGDDTRIDWGYVYAAAPTEGVFAAVSAGESSINGFVEQGKLTPTNDSRMPRAANDHKPCLTFQFDVGRVGANPVSRHLMVAYDEIFAIRFLGRNLRPFWRKTAPRRTTCCNPPSGITRVCVIAARRLTTSSWPI